MGNIFHILIYQPIYNILVLLYNLIPGKDFGIAIILLTVLIRVILIPFYRKQVESQLKMQELQPKIKEIQHKYKDNKEEQTKKLMEFYKENKTNPFSGCLPLIVQILFFIAIYRVLFAISSTGLAIDSAQLYSFIPNPGKVNQFFIGLVDLTKASVVIAVLAAVSQYYQTKMLMAKQTVKQPAKSEDEGPDMAQMMNKQMVIIGPALTLFIGLKFPAGLSLYWLTSTVFMLVQQIIIEKKK